VQKYSLIYNPVSGGGKGAEAATKAEASLRLRGVEFTSVPTKSLEHAEQLGREAAESGRVSLACGGDGVIGAVARGCSQGDGVLALVPGGRGNDFARALGLPVDTDEAIEVALSGVERRIDLGSGNEVSFCCIASCGYDSDANRIANELSGNGSLDYVRAAIKALINWRPAQFTLVLDGREREFSGYSVVVANTMAYGGGMKIAPDADPADGMFDVVTIEDSSKLVFFLRFPLVFAGKHTGSKVVKVERARTVEIKADRDFVVYADGDPLCSLPAKIEVREGAVRMMLKK
jgi:YegS/Rv2252/BmrU family lipid kinase